MVSRTPRLPVQKPVDRRKGEASFVDGMWTLRIPKLLVSPNRTLWTHWSKKSLEKRDWFDAIVATILDGLGRPAFAVLPASSKIPGARGTRCDHRCRLEITRLVASRRAFMRDVDNLMFSTKHLVDALRDVGLIHDDDQIWIERTVPLQHISDDGQAWTIVTVQPLLSPEAL